MTKEEKEMIGKILDYIANKRCPEHFGVVSRCLWNEKKKFCDKNLCREHWRQIFKGVFDD